MRNSGGVSANVNRLPTATLLIERGKIDWQLPGLTLRLKMEKWPSSNSRTSILTGHSVVLFPFFFDQGAVLDSQRVPNQVFLLMELNSNQSSSIRSFDFKDGRSLFIFHCCSVIVVNLNVAVQWPSGKISRSAYLLLLSISIGPVKDFWAREVSHKTVGVCTCRIENVFSFLDDDNKKSRSRCRFLNSRVSLHSAYRTASLVVNPAAVISAICQRASSKRSSRRPNNFRNERTQPEQAYVHTGSHGWSKVADGELTVGCLRRCRDFACCHLECRNG